MENEIINVNLDKNNKKIGKINYDSYEKFVIRKTMNGEIMKIWEELPINIKKAWLYAGLQIFDSNLNHDSIVTYLN
jgi:hypothetical protein